MSEISLILVLQNKNKQNSEWHGKNTNKISTFLPRFFDFNEAKKAKRELA